MQGRITIGTIARRFVRRVLDADLPDELAEETLTVMLGRVMPELKHRIAAHHRRHAGKAAFAHPPMFNIPSMPDTSRRISVGGERTFHMGSGGPTGGSGAARADRYGADKAAKIATTHEADLELQQKRTAGDERGAAIADGYAVDHGGAETSRRLVFTDLRVEDDARRLQWNEIEAIEAGHGLTRKRRYEKGLDRINVRPAAAPALVSAIAGDDDCPASLRETILAEQERLAAGDARGGRREKIGAAFVGDEAHAVHSWIRSTEAWRMASIDERKAISLSRGRSRQSYVAIDCELPSVFDDQACSAVARGVQEFLATTPGAPGAEIADARVPVTASVHYPDACNNASNKHFHVVHGKRRFLLSPTGELIRDDDGNAIFEDVMPPAFTTLGSKHLLRAEYATLANIELERLGADYRLTAGTDADVGNDGPTMQKLYTKATVFSRAGVATEQRLDNTAIGWGRKFDDAERDHARMVEREGRRARALARKLDLMEKRGNDVGDLRIAAADRHAMATEGVQVEHEARTVALMIAAARSAPREVAQFAPGYAEAAEARGAAYDSTGWRRRAHEAETFLQMLDADLALERDAVRERQAFAEQTRLMADAALERLVAGMATAALRRLVTEHHEPANAAATPPEVPAVAPAIPALPDLEPVDRWSTALADTRVLLSAGGQPILAFDDVDPLDGDHGDRLDGRAHAPIGSWTDIPALFAASPPAAGGHARAKPSPNQAIRLIDTTPLRISRDDDRLFVGRADDPDGIVADADLGSVQARLGGLHRSQQRELRQVTAFLTKHGPDALDTVAVNASTAWLDVAIRRWRDTPLLRRAIAAHPVPSTMQLASQPPPPVSDDGAAKPDMARRPPAAASPLSEEELSFEWFILETARRQREAIEHEVQVALEKRAGGANSLTPLGARLLLKVANGFRHEAASSDPRSTSLDRFDAIEIAILSTSPVFGQRLKAAEAGDRELIRWAEAVERRHPAPDLLGRITQPGKRIKFDYRPDADDSEQHTRPPLDWIREALVRIDRRPPLLSRVARGADMVVGLYDNELLLACDYNYIGLLHPEAQARLEAIWRVQQEQRRMFVAGVQRGAIEVRPRLVRRNPRDAADSVVSLAPTTDRSMRLPAMLATDPAFFLACRRAQTGGKDKAEQPLNDDLTVAAWLRARSEGAALMVLRLLADRVLTGTEAVEQRLEALDRGDALALVASGSDAAAALVDARWRPSKPASSQIVQRGRRSLHRGGTHRGR